MKNIKEETKNTNIKKEKDPQKKYTKRDDPKPDIEVADDISFDIELVTNWVGKLNKDLTNDINRLIKNVKCDNTLHGLKILKKIISIDDLVLSDEFIYGVILHDVVKYKKREKVINIIFNRYLGPGRWVSVKDHGINAGYLLSAIFGKVNIRLLNFVFMHTKDRPYELDPDSWNDHELAFFIFDDLIRDLNVYKIKLSKEEFEKVRSYYQHPKKNQTREVFNILKEYHQTKED